MESRKSKKIRTEEVPEMKQWNYLATIFNGVFAKNDVVSSSNYKKVVKSLEILVETTYLQSINFHWSIWSLDNQFFNKPKFDFLLLSNGPGKLFDTVIKNSFYRNITGN